MSRFSDDKLKFILYEQAGFNCNEIEILDEFYAGNFEFVKNNIHEHDKNFIEYLANKCNSYGFAELENHLRIYLKEDKMSQNLVKIINKDRKGNS